MSEKSKFIRSSIILFCANACSKILGALYKIPLTYIIKEEGMAVYQTAFAVYTVFLTFVTVGFPFATTKLLAEYNAIGKRERFRPVVKSVALILFATGLAMSAVMFLFAEQIALSMREPNAADAMRAIAFAVFFVSGGGIVKASNEACGELVPTALSQVLEAGIKLLLGLAFAKALLHISIYKSASGAALAVTVGEAFATLLLFSMWIFSVRRLPKGLATSDELRQIFSIALPLLLCGAATSVLSMAEVSVTRNALEDLKFTEQSAKSFMSEYSAFTDAFDTLPDTYKLTQNGVRKIFGGYSGYAQTVFNLPAGIIATVTAAATPMFANALSQKSNTCVISSIERVLSLIMLLAVPSCVILLIFPSEILQILFKNSFSANMLRVLSPSLIFLCANNLFIALLHLSGRIFEPFAAILCGIVLRLVLSACLIRIPSINILGLGIATVLASVILFLMLVSILKRHFSAKPSLLRVGFVSLGSSLLMVGAILPVRKYLLRFLNTDFAFLVATFAGICIYAIAALLFFLQAKSPADR